jgi:hypothetical protein
MATAVVSEESMSRRWWLRLPERLPDLRGQWLTAYSVCWTGVLLIALVGDVGGAAYRLKLGAGETYTWGPLGLYLADKGGVVRNVAGDAQEAGIRSGDSIIAMNGVLVLADTSSTTDQSNALDSKLQRMAEGEPVRLTVRAKRGALHDVTVIRRGSNAGRLYAGTGLTPQSVTIFCALAFFLAPLAFIAAACMLFGRRRDPVAALLSISFVLPACGWGSLLWSRLIGAAGTKIALGIIGPIGSIGFIVVLLTFPQGRFEPRWTLPIALSLPVFAVISAVDPNAHWPDWFVRAIVAAALLSMIIRYRKTPQSERQQWRWALLGFVTGIGLLIPWDLAYGAYLQRHSDLGTDLWSWILTPTVTGVFILLVAGGVTLSVLRYRLYDTSAAVSRSAAYGVLTLGFVALFAGVEKLTEIVGERYFEHSVGIAAGAIGAAVAATCIVPLHNRVHRWAERRFQKPLIRLREGLPECVADLRESVSVDQLAEAVMHRVHSGVRSTREAVLLADNGKLVVARARGLSAKAMREWQSGWSPHFGDHALDCDRRDVTFPLRVRLCIESADEPKTIGWLLLGPRPDGSFFGKDERDALAHVAGPVARAIHIAQLREQRDTQAERRLTALERLIEKVATALSAGPGLAAAD